MANYFTTLIAFKSKVPGVLEDLHNHILAAARISKSFFAPPFASDSWTKFYTVAMTYGVQTVYDIGRCTIVVAGDVTDTGFAIITKTAYTPMLVFWVDLINTFYYGNIDMNWRSYAEENYVITNTESEQTLYSITAMSEGDNVIKLDRLFDTKNAPFYGIDPKNYRLDKIGSNGNTELAFEDYQVDLAESDCIEYLRGLSSKYDDMQNLWQVLADPKYTFDGDILINQDSLKTTKEVVEDDLDCWASVQDPEIFEGIDYDDMMYKTYDDPRLFVEQQPIKPEPCDQQQFPDCTDGNIMN